MSKFGIKEKAKVLEATTLFQNEIQQDPSKISELSQEDLTILINNIGDSNAKF